MQEENIIRRASKTTQSGIKKIVKLSSNALILKMKLPITTLHISFRLSLRFYPATVHLFFPFLQVERQD